MVLKRRVRKHMPKENNNAALIEQIERASEALTIALSLARKNTRKATSKKAAPVKARQSSKDLDFSTPMRAFVKRYGADMSGPKKFTLLLAYLAKGDTKARVSLTEIVKFWNKMTAKNLLGMKFNRFYTSDAKENDWVNTEKSGSYHLRPSWKDIFDE